MNERTNERTNQPNKQRTNEPTNYLEQSYFWEANISSDSQKTPGMLQQSEGSFPHSQQPTVVWRDVQSEALHSISQYVNSLRRDVVIPLPKPQAGGPPPIGFPPLFYSIYSQLPFKSAGRLLDPARRCDVGGYFTTFRSIVGLSSSRSYARRLKYSLACTSSHLFVVSRKTTGLVTVQSYTTWNITMPIYVWTIGGKN